jgi:hypothetical protein
MDDRQVRSLRVVWIALVNSILIYLALAFFVIRPETPKRVGEAIGELQVQVLYGLGLLMLVLSAIIPRILLRAENGRVSMERIKVALTVRWALVESVAVFGLLAAFVSQSPGLFAPMGVIALTALLLAFPTDSLIESYQNPQ